jgi:Flp pilus assembly protein TadD
LKETNATLLAEIGIWEALFGLRQQAIATTNEALKASDSPAVAEGAAFVFALGGDDTRAERVMDGVAAKRPYDTTVQNVENPLLRSVLELNRGNSDKALDQLNTALVYARADIAVLYARGWAQLQARQGSEAIQAFQRIIDLRGVRPVDPLIAMAHLGVARAYAQQGDNARSRVAYQDTLALWKDADSDLPLVKQAKEEYARVQ